jgi:nitrite reductase (NADH) large subunit
MKYVIIGNGVAGMEAALTIRKIDSQGEIIILSKSKVPFYYRPKLINYLAGTVNLSGITIYKEEFYCEHNIQVMLDTVVTNIDPIAHQVIDNRGNKLAYDRLLLATGADCFLPPFPGGETAGVFTVRGISDCDAILNYVRHRERIAVVGGGLLGLETAYALKTLGKQVTVIEVNQWLLSRQLDREGGELLKQLLENKGLQFILKDTLSAIDAHEGQVSGISMKSGQRLDVQAVIVSAGIRGRDSLARQIGAQINKGIVVDDAMQTTVPDVFAAGDPIEHRGMLYGIWPAAKEQGAAAGNNMAGKPLAYTGTFLSSNLKITGIDVYSAGDYNSPSDDLIYSIQAGIYKKYLIQGSKLAAAMVVGDAQEAKLASLVYQGKAPLDELSQNSMQPASTDKYECATCGHIYDPVEGDPEHGIPKGTPFENLPEDWTCPLCSMEKAAFKKVS